LKIHVEFAALLKVSGLRSGEWMEVPEGFTVSALLSRLDVQPEHQKFVVPFINKEKVKLHHALRDQDRVFLSLPVGGG
jgi:sulfur carrier protein ThiS